MHNTSGATVKAKDSTIRAESAWSNTATACGLVATARASVLELSRRLVEAGHDDRPLEVWRWNRLCLRVKSIGAGARRTVREDGDARRFVLYQDRQERRPAASPVRQNEEEATPGANEADLFAAEAAE
jgi:hypothetical protein